MRKWRRDQGQTSGESGEAARAKILRRHSLFPGGAGGKEHACWCRRHKRRGFDPWVQKTPYRRTWQPTPVFLPGKSLGPRILVGYIIHRVAYSQA